MTCSLVGFVGRDVRGALTPIGHDRCGRHRGNPCATDAPHRGNVTRPTLGPVTPNHAPRVAFHRDSCHYWPALPSARPLIGRASHRAGIRTLPTAVASAVTDRRPVVGPSAPSRRRDSATRYPGNFATHLRAVRSSSHPTCRGGSGRRGMVRYLDCAVSRFRIRPGSVLPPCHAP